MTPKRHKPARPMYERKLETLTTAQLQLALEEAVADRHTMAFDTVRTEQQRRKPK